MQRQDKTINKPTRCSRQDGLKVEEIGGTRLCFIKSMKWLLPHVVMLSSSVLRCLMTKNIGGGFRWSLNRSDPSSFSLWFWQIRLPWKSNRSTTNFASDFSPQWAFSLSQRNCRDYRGWGTRGLEDVIQAFDIDWMRCSSDAGFQRPMFLGERRQFSRIQGRWEEEAIRKVQYYTYIDMLSYEICNFSDLGSFVNDGLFVT